MSRRSHLFCTHTTDRHHTIVSRSSHPKIYWAFFTLFTVGWWWVVLSALFISYILPPALDTYALTGQNLTETHYQWRNDDGDEATATSAAAEDTAIALTKNTTTRLRMGISNAGSATADATSLRLQYAPRVSGTCAQIAEGSWVTVPTTATTQHFQLADSPNLTNGNPTTNSANSLTDPGGKTFLAGAAHDTTIDPANIAPTSSQFTEMEYGIKATADATIGGNYCMRTINAAGVPVKIGTLGLSGEHPASAAVLDTANGFAYFGTSSSPGIIVKVQLSDFTRVGALTLNSGENNLTSAVLDTANGFAYFGTYTSPGIIVKVQLSDFTRVGALTLQSGEDSFRSAVLDTANGFVYFSTETSPGIIVKVRLSDFTRVGALTLNSGEDYLYSAVLDSANGFAYFSTSTSPGIIVKVRLSDFTRVGALTLNTGEDNIRLAVLDSANGFAYFVTFVSPRKIVKVRLSDFTRVGALDSGQSSPIISAVLDSANGFAYFGINSASGSVMKIDVRNILDTYSAYAQVAVVNVPGAPTLSSPSASSFVAVIDQNGNDASITYAIQVTPSGQSAQWVQADGTLGASEVWQTYTAWGGAVGVMVTGLSANVVYTAKVKARNGELVATSLSGGSSIYTAANVPSAPTVSAALYTSFVIAVNENNNPASTTYAIQVTPSGQSATWVQTDGTLGASAVLQTYATWGSATGVTVTGLTVGTSYAIAVKARNGDGMDTAMSASATQRTLTPSSGEARFDQMPPAIPTNFSVIPHDGKALLTWIDPPDADFARIIILRGEGNLPVSGDVYNVAEKGVQQFVDARVSKDMRYTYILSAQDRAGNFALTEKRSVMIKKEEPPTEPVAPLHEAQGVTPNAESPTTPVPANEPPPFVPATTPVLSRHLSDVSLSPLPQNSVVYENVTRAPDDAERATFTQTAAVLLEEKLPGVMERLFVEHSVWRDTYTRAYLFGGYNIEEITQAIRFGGKTVHPTIPASAWRRSPDYTAYITRR